MANQLTNNAEVLRLFFTEDVYLVEDMPSLSERSFQYVGENARRILILVNDASHKVSTEAGTLLLRNIVKAIGLGGNDFALLNYAVCDAPDFDALARFFSPKLVFLFGVAPVELGLKEYPLETYVQERGIQLVYTRNLVELASDNEAKKALWAVLKRLEIPQI